MGVRIDLIGREFRGGVVLHATDKKQGGSPIYLCKCNNCGKENWELSARRIIHNNPISCGCLNNKSISITKHGMAKNGESDRFYRIWVKIKNRCYSKDKTHIKYKENNIQVCDRWKNSFKNFKEDMYEGYINACKKYEEKFVSIDRIDVNGDYTPKNTRWANMVTQLYNRNYIKHKSSKFILATRLDDGHNIITVNARIFAIKIFNRKNSHIIDVCKNNRPQEKGWTFKYITEEEYFLFKNNGMDYIENAEIFNLSINSFEVDIETSSNHHKTRDEYYESLKCYFINKENKIAHGIRSQIFEELGFNDLNNFIYSIEKPNKDKVRKLTEYEIKLYKQNKEDLIDFYNIKE